jgi:broad specificity phosphatase PhoE
VSLRLTLIRHSVTELNTAGVLRGWLDPPLSEIGISLAKQLPRFTGRLYSSDLLRARMTSEWLGRATYTLALRPWNVGEYAGAPMDHVHEKLAALRELYTVPCPGGESFHAFVQRYLGFLLSLTEDSVLVTHYRNFYVMRCWTKALVPYADIEYNVEPCSILRVNWRNAK